MLLIWLVSVGSLLLALSDMNVLVIEGSQIIAYLAYQPLILPTRIDPLSPIPFSRLLTRLHLTLDGENPSIPSMSKQCLF